MKRILFLSVALMMAISMMAIGDNSGSTKANAKEFDWDKGIKHDGGTLWYRVDLAPLYDEENPSLTLYLTNPSNLVGGSVDVSMQATVAGESESKSYTIKPREYKTYTANASMLVRMKQTEIYLTLTSNGEIKLSAKVFEAEDLDETCKDARTLNWNTVTTQDPTYSAWWKVSLKPIKDATNQDAKITITNTGGKTVNLKIGQSLDCPSSGLTKRTYELAAGQVMESVIPRDMILNVQPDEIYFGIENVESQVSIKVETQAQPADPVISASDPYDVLHVTDTIVIAAGTHLYRIDVKEMRDTAKYEPEFTYRNEGTSAAKVTVKMAFGVPAFGTSDTEYDLAAGDEEIVVYKKNMLEGLGEEVQYIYLLTEVTEDIHFYGRFKHVREGKACKTNIDFGELVPTNVRHQEAGVKAQWYAVYIGAARFEEKDIIVHLENEGTASAKVSAALAFSCPYIDLQEVTRTIGVGASISKKLSYTAYAGMAEDYVWIGVTTNQNIKIWAETQATATKDPSETTCVLDQAETFDWEEGVDLQANTPTWYVIDMKEARDLAAKFPTIFVQNQDDVEATISAEMSLECPDIYENESRTLKVAANGSYSKQLSRNMFENIQRDTIYLKVTSTTHVSFQIRMTEQEPGTMCSSAIPFNWTSGNDVAANSNQWVSVDLRKVLKDENKPSVAISIKNKGNETCKGTAWLAYECQSNTTPSLQDVNFSLAAKGTKEKTLPYSLVETASDSIVWIRIVANTTVHVDADLVYRTTPYDTIFCGDIVVAPDDTLDWNTTYTYPAGVTSKWYVMPKALLQSLEGLTTTPEIRVKDKSGASNTIKAEIAYGCPIVSDMISQKRTLSAGQELTKLIERTTMEQVMKKDIVYIRLTAQGEFEFEAKLVNPNTGNDRAHALMILPDSIYNQPANTTMWYKIDTRELKKDQTLHGKSLHIDTRNLGAKALVKVWLYEDVSEEDLIETFTGIKDKGQHKIPAGEHRSRNIPAYSLYGAGDVELYIKVETDQPMQFSTKLSDYAPLAAPIAVKDTAILAVPNITYDVPANNDMAWYAVCVPYIRNNYSLNDASNIDFYNPNATEAHVSIITTWQDTLTFQVPERSRTIAAGSHHTETYKQLVNRLIKRLGFHYDVEGTQTSFIEEQLRKYLTADSVTAYFRILTDQPLQLRINMPQTTGFDCGNTEFMMFDWEHGNVNPAGEETFFLVELPSWRVPDHTALRLHVENWGENQNQASAELRYKCSDPLPIVDKINYTINPKQDKWKDINRDVLANLGWSNIIIDYTSSETSRIWVEIVPEKPRDTVWVDTLILACYGDTIYDTFVNPNVRHIMDVMRPDTLFWNDTIEFVNDTALAMWDSIVRCSVITRLNPDVQPIPLDQRPAIKRGQVIDFAATTTYLMGQFAAADNSNDTIADVDNIFWIWTTNGVTYNELPAGTVTNTEALKLSYKYVTECKDTLAGDTITYIARDTLVVTDCEEYVWTDPTPARIYYESKLDSVVYPAGTGLDSVRYLDVTILQPSKVDFTEEACESFTWTFNNQVYTVSGTYEDTIHGGAANHCDSIGTLYLTIKNKVEKAIEETACDSYTWDGDEYTVSGQYQKIYTAANGCDSIVTLTLTINNSVTNAISVEACKSYVWDNDEYTTSGQYEKTFTAVNGCDSTVTLTLTILDPYEVTDTQTACKSYDWEGDTYTQSGQYQKTLTAANGCDSIVTLDLTILDPYEVTDTQSACKSYEWEGDIYTASGQYQKTLTAANGCDSIVTLDLTILPAVETTAPAVTECDSYYWAEADTTITASGTYKHIFSTVEGCDSIVTLPVTIKESTGGQETRVACGSYKWNGKEYTESGDYTITMEAENGCDSVATLHLTINQPTAGEETQVACVSYTWHGKEYTESGDYTYTTTNVADCDSVATLHLTILQPVVRDTVADECNLFVWRDVAYNMDTIVYDTIVGGASNGCDSIVKLDLKIGKPFVGELDLIHKYGDRLLMINRTQINQLLADSLDRSNDTTLVRWYRESTPEDEFLCYGYYYTNDGQPVPPGIYYAIVEIPPTDGAKCGAKGETEHYVVGAKAGVPALVPTLALPGQDIKVINLDPEQHTTIRIYTTEGMLHGTYTTTGETTFTIKAAEDHGFYLVELIDDSMKSTLRYIVK